LLERDAIEILVNYARLYDPDIIKFNALIEPGGKKYIGYNFKNVHPVLAKREDIYYELYCTPLLHEMALNFYRSDIVRGAASFKEKMSFGEDYYTNLEIIPKAKTALFIDDKLYHYDKSNQNSTTHAKSIARARDNVDDAIRLNNAICKKVQSISASLKPEAYASMLTTYMWAWYGMFQAEKQSGIEDARDYAFRAITSSEAMVEIRNNLDKKELRKIIKGKGLKFRLFHGGTVMALYAGDRNKSTKNATRYAHGYIFR
jgi:hypothetical protein